MPAARSAWGSAKLIVFAMGLNVMAGIGAASFAWLDDWIGSRHTILLSLTGLFGFGAAIVVAQEKAWFFGLALTLGIFIGPAAIGQPVAGGAAGPRGADRQSIRALRPDRTGGQLHRPRPLRLGDGGDPQPAHRARRRF